MLEYGICLLHVLFDKVHTRGERLKKVYCRFFLCLTDFIVYFFYKDSDVY